MGGMKGLVLALALAGTGSTAWGQENFPDIRENHWAFETAAELASKGLLSWPKYERAFRNAPLFSRSEWAMGIVDTILDLPMHMRFKLRDLSGAKTEGSIAYWRDQRSLFAHRWRTSVARLVQEFSPEIRQWGSQAKEMLTLADECKPIARQIVQLCDARLKALGAAPLFSDVPFDHWAFDAVHNLRDLGILTGYPDGTFKGKGR